MGIMDILGPIGSVAGGVIDAFSQGSANASNERNVQKQIDFQREQSGTQYQRAVEDLKKAGLNPALAYSQGGNTAATGAAAQVQPTMRDTGNKVATALQTSNLQKEGKLLEAQAEAANANAYNVRMDAATKQPEVLWAHNVVNQALYGDVKNLELGTRQREAGRDTERFETTLANTRADTNRAHRAAALAGSAERLNRQDYMPESLLESVLPWANATARGLDIAGKGVGLFGGVQNLQLNKLKMKPKPEAKKNYDQEETYDPESRMKFTRRTYRP